MTYSEEQKRIRSERFGDGPDGSNIGRAVLGDVEAMSGQSDLHEQVFVVPVGTIFPPIDKEPSPPWVLLNVPNSYDELYHLFEAVKGLYQNSVDFGVDPKLAGFCWHVSSVAWEKLKTILKEKGLTEDLEHNTLFGLPIVIDEQQILISYVLPNP